VIVASVSCIYGLGSPEVYDENLQTLSKGEMIDRDALLRKLVSIQYNRNDTALARGTFRVAARRSRSSPPTPRRRTGSCCSATRSSICSTSTR
jgi:hypothetical protein